jgi:hypothetical protein
MMRGVAFAWLVLSLSARRSGLLGEVLREPRRKGVLRLRDGFLAGKSAAASALKARESVEGAVGEALGDFTVNVGWRAGFEGERDKERRICCMEAKPSMDRPWA